MLLACVLCSTVAAVEIELRAPLTTSVRGDQPYRGPGQRLAARVIVPEDAPHDLGVGAFAADRFSRWYQSARPAALAPGTHELVFELDGPLVRSEPARSAWNANVAGEMDSAGLFFWSASASRARIVIESLRLVDAAAAPPTPSLSDVAIDGLDGLAGDGGAMRVQAGERWTVSLLPRPFPSNAFDPERFTVDAVVTTPDGTVERIPGFYLQAMGSSDRGDREVVTPLGAGRFCVRYRPRQAGTHRITLEARWHQPDAAVTLPLPPLEVTGPAWDGFVRVDRRDPRFFASGADFFWPLGPNLHAITDLRAQEKIGNRPTPERGSLSYRAYLERLAAAGGSATEIWMSAWNLALEWTPDRPGYHGLGRYSQENGWRLDRILDDAWRLGIRVNLVVNNHGQAAPSVDGEWGDSPYFRRNGGPCADALQYFTDPLVLARQDELRRYLVARYADHPAIFGWKLWSEVNFVAAQGETLRRWHEQAAARWHALDAYGRGVTTHWADDYLLPDRDIVRLPGIDFVCIDAYYHPNHRPLMADLITRSTLDPSQGLARFGKPVLVSEYGCSWFAGPGEQMAADHASVPWAALVSGHAGSPMLWWIEWLDQGDRYEPYRALSRFLVGEDLRGSDAGSLAVVTRGPDLWARAWKRPGRMLGYVLDSAWGWKGGVGARREGVRLELGSVAAGAMRVEWWSADDGTRIAERRLTHGGGALVLEAPPFNRHLAFKLSRTDEGGARDPHPPSR
ncbi:MAG TPA: hypothetical protein VEL07_16025 [Planctomycetota bacterium]|nr:hypothetical protein [Planctomycetota bacterium]